jgi:glycerol dehydrogenase
MVNSSTRAFGGPMKYIQGLGEFNKMAEYTNNYGGRAFFLIDGFLFKNLNNRLESIYKAGGYPYNAVPFSGECCQEEIERVSDLVRNVSADVLIGVGGGKTLDTMKAVASELGLSLIIVPTSASTDAPTSAMSVLYTKDGTYIKNIRHKKNAVLVLMDTEIISKAPIRLFISGMGDALATYFEAMANDASDSTNYIGKGYRRCKAAMAIAKACFEILMEDGIKAKLALERNICSEAVENVIEANTLMSGLGFENTGCACAHGIHAGLTELPSTHKFFHGEKVAFGVLCQMMLENTCSELFEKVMDFMVNIGLPVTLKQLDVENNPENVRVIAHFTAIENKLIKSEPMAINEEIVYNAIMAADAIGNYCLNKKNGK